MNKIIDGKKVFLHRTPIGWVKLNMEITQGRDGPVLHLIGDMDRCHWQISKQLREVFKADPDMQRFCDIWDRWHLNDLHAGCIHQRAFEREPYEKHRGAQCDICNYTYGTAWIYEPLPEGLVEELKELMNKLEKKYDCSEAEL